MIVTLNIFYTQMKMMDMKDLQSGEKFITNNRQVKDCKYIYQYRLRIEFY